MFFPPYSRTSALQGLGLALLLLFVCAPAHAQSNGDGSPYSRFGLGTLTDFSSSQSEALGRGGYAVRSLNYNPTANPALWSDQVYTRLSAGGSYQRIRATGGDNQESRLTSSTIEALQFSFPLYKRKLGVGLTFQPYTQHNYRLRDRGTLSFPSASGTETIPFEKTLQGVGGLHTLRGGLGYRITDALRVGASFDVLFGIVERRLSNRSAFFQNVTLTDATRLTGITGTVGGHLALADVFRTDDAFSIGASLALPTTLSGTRVLTSGEGRDLSPDTIASVSGEVTLPWRGRLGAAYQPNTRWTLTADGLYEPWSTLTTSFGSRAPFRRSFPQGGVQTLTDRWRVSLGAEVVPAGNDALAGYFARMAYRLGAYTERLYVRPNGRTNLQTYAVTAGFSFPTSLAGTRIDLNLNAGTRGTTKNTLVRDTFFGVALHVNFGEQWFKERKLR